jgi:hypothetical protein
LQKGFAIDSYLHNTVHLHLIDFSGYSIFERTGDHLRLSLQEAPHFNQPAHPFSGGGRFPGGTDCDTSSGCNSNGIMLVLWEIFLCDFSIYQLFMSLFIYGQFDLDIY